jgi:group I intron endonuclease
VIGIYKIINPNGKVYVGQSINIENRLKQHRFFHDGKKTRIYNSIKKYGWGSHFVEILEECSVEKLNERERFWQEHFDSFNKGLNAMLTESSAKRREYSKNNFKSVKKVYSEEGLKSLKEKLTGMNNPFFGKTHSKEVLEKIIKANKGKKYSEETKKKMSDNAKKRSVGGGNNYAKKVIDTSTNQIFGSIKEAASHYNMKTSLLYTWLNKPNRNKSNLKFYNAVTSKSDNSCSERS